MSPELPSISLPASRLVMLAGSSLIAAVVIGTAFLGWHERQAAVDAETAKGELLARLAEDHATRTFETTSIALASLAELLSRRGGLDNADRLAANLSQALLGLPFLRSVAVLDPQGHVMASTSSMSLGLRVPMELLGPLPAAGHDSIGPPLPGRDLADLDPSRPVGAGPPPGLGFVPFLRRLVTEDGRSLLLVGLLNPDSFATYQASALSREAPGSSVVLASYQGRVLASTRDAPAGLGASLAETAVFRAELPVREHGSLVVDTARGRQLIAFRASRTLPLVVLIERPYAAAVARWWAAMRWLCLFAAMGVGFIGITLAVAWRSLHAREAARRQLDEAQARIAHSERELSVLIKSVQELIFRTDAVGTLTFVSTRWLAVSGQSPGEAVGRKLYDLVQPDCAETVKALFALDRDDGIRTAPVSVEGAGGQVRLYDVAVVPLRAASRIIGFAGSAMDVTDRRRAERLLKAQLAFTNLLLETSPLPVAMADPLGRLVSVNHAWEEFFGQDRRVALGRLSNDYYPSPASSSHPGTDAACREGDRDRTEARLRHADGSFRDVVVTQVQILNEDPQMAGTLSVFMDVSEYRQAERSIQEARDAAEDASRTKSEFIANISHELRTPLQSILGFSELGLARTAGQEKFRAMFEAVHTAGERMLAVVNDLLDVAKIESTVGTFHLERTDLRGVIRAVAQELTPLLDRRGLALRLMLPGTPLLVKVDPMRIQQVIRNVLANAIKFSPVNDSIELQADLRPATQEVHLQVRDQGPGIPAGEHDKIFEPFVQSSETKDGSGGTGLGLAICRKIVEAHGGRIRAENAAPTGAVFHIYLPLRRADETQPGGL